MFRGRLGLDPANILHADRHGLLWLARGNLFAEAGTLRFKAASSDEMPAGIYDIPFQSLSCLLMQPGTTVTHDALRLLARHGTGLVFVGEGGVRMYASMPKGPDASALARRQVRAWSDPELRIDVARRMYAWRLGEILPHADIEVLRGIEGVRVRKGYRLAADRYGIPWRRREYDRAMPESNDMANNALNHASVAVLATAEVAVAVVGAVPQLGFIHEDSGISFCLDIADMYRQEVTVDCAFAAVAQVLKKGGNLERTVRRMVGRRMREMKLVDEMITRIKELFEKKHDDEGEQVDDPRAEEPVPASGDGDANGGGLPVTKE